VCEGPAAAGSSTGLAAVKLDGHKYVSVAVAAGNTIKVRIRDYKPTGPGPTA
jgi:hypothetical protein